MSWENFLNGFGKSDLLHALKDSNDKDCESFFLSGL